MVPIFVQHSEMSGLVRMSFFQPTFWVQLEFTIGPPPYYNRFLYKMHCCSYFSRVRVKVRVRVNVRVEVKVRVRVGVKVRVKVMVGVKVRVRVRVKC